MTYSNTAISIIYIFIYNIRISIQEDIMNTDMYKLAYTIYKLFWILLTTQLWFDKIYSYIKYQIKHSGT